MDILCTLYTKTRETRTESDIRLIVRLFVPSFVLLVEMRAFPTGLLEKFGTGTIANAS